MAAKVLPKVLAAGKQSWKIKTTRDNLQVLKSARERSGQPAAELDAVISAFQSRHDELCGEEVKHT